MPDRKRWMVATNYYLTRPFRRVINAKRNASGNAPSLILFYHRVADDHPNDWTISNRLFEKQIQWIRKRFEIVSLAECQRRLKAGKNDSPTVSITFDDGYADNCARALPFLIRNKIPFTYFVTLDPILTGTRFPHDVKADQPIAPNSVEQIKALADAGVDIGAHTRTHPDIGKIKDEAKLRDEIVDSKAELERLIGRKVDYFAFPFGLPHNMHKQAVTLAKEAGFVGVCSAYGAYNFPSDRGDFFHLKRIHADAEMLRLKNWLTIDWRKLSVPEPSFFADLAVPSTSKTAAAAELNPEFTTCTTPFNSP